MHPKSWERKIPELPKFYADYYARCLAGHDVFFIHKISEDIRIWWANLLTETVFEDEQLWKNGKELWKPAGSLFLKLSENKNLELKSPARIKRIFLRSKRNKYLFPKDTTELKVALKESLTRYLEDPNNSDNDYVIRLTG